MWTPPPPLAPRVRSKPHFFSHEQEDDRLHADEAADLLRAMRMSIHPESGSETDTDSDGDDEAKDESEEDDDVDEEVLINTLGEEEREKYDGVVEDEEKRGWGSYSPITVQPFASPPMAVPVLNGCTTPLHFHALLPLTFFDHVTDRTNIYAMARHGPGKENTPPSLSTRARAAEEEEAGAGWTPTSSEEILALVGCVIAMGMVKISRTADYWSQDLGLPFVIRTFPHERFKQLLRVFHLADNLDPHAAADRIHKVRHLNNLIIKQSQAAHYPSQQLTVDEAMVGSKGRSGLRQSPKGFRRALMQALVGTFTARKKRGRPSLQPKLAADEVHHIPQLRAKDQVCTVCSKTMRRSQGKHKPRTREGCGTCGVAVHFACWKEHLPHEEEDEEGGEE